MDRVRFGRVLGRGARMAARTVYEAVDAATTSPTESGAARPPKVPPSERHRQSRVTDQPATGHTLPKSQAGVQQAVQQTVKSVQRVQGSARAARSGVLGPVKRASQAVSLEIAGSFFALFALSFAVGAWRFRTEGTHGAHLWVYLGCAAVFSYFALTSFARARRLTSR